jgi:hypothetical protein
MDILQDNSESTFDIEVDAEVVNSLLRSRRCRWYMRNAISLYLFGLRARNSHSIQTYHV